MFSVQCSVTLYSILDTDEVNFIFENEVIEHVKQFLKFKFRCKSVGEHWTLNIGNDEFSDFLRKQRTSVESPFSKHQTIHFRLMNKIHFSYRTTFALMIDFNFYLSFFFYFSFFSANLVSSEQVNVFLRIELHVPDRQWWVH